MPKLLKTPFAIDAAEGFRTDIQESTGAAPNSATYQVGFPPVTMQSIASNGMPPKGSDLNGVLYDITDNLVFLTQGGGYGFDSAYATSIGGYPLNARLRLTNGDIAKSTVDGNTNDPNTDMTGWVNVNSASQIFDASGKTQQELNTGLSNIADMLSIESPVNGARLFVKSYNGVLNHALAVPYYAGTDFIYDSSKSSINDGVTIFNGWVRQFNGILKPEYAGAIGDGISDDSEAFRKIRDVGFDYAYNRPSYNNNVALAGYVVELSPFKNYLVKGDMILGSRYDIDTSVPHKAITFKLIGNNANITYEPLQEFDRLFNINAFIERPSFSDFNLYVKSSNTVNSGVIWYLNSGYNGRSGASRMSIDRVRVAGVSGNSNKIRRVFDINGSTMADQITVNHSTFQTFKEFWKSDNPESVNCTIKNCGFVSMGQGGVTYFNISRMGDNFNFTENNLSINSGDVLFNFIAPLNSAGTLINSNPAYQFHAKQNRIETYGSGEVIMLNSNHLKLNVSGLTSALGSGSGSTKWVWRASEMGSYQFDKCSLNNPQKLLAPILSSLSYGNTVGTGVKLNDIGYLASLELGAWDGTNEYSVKDALVNKRKARSFRFRDCSQSNRGGAWDFDIVFDEDNLSNGIRKQHTVTLNKAGTGLATEFQIPPYQVIDEVSVTTVGTLPASYNGFRVYFGKKAENNYIDYVSTLGSIVAETETVIFKGKGIIFNDVINDNVISVYALQDGVEVTTKTLSSITVKYTAVSTYRDNIISMDNATIVKNTLLPKNVGATSSRPTKAPYIGWQYFDTTIGKPIYVKTLSPVTWVDAAGVAV